MAGIAVITALGFSLAVATPWGSLESKDFADKATKLRLQGNYPAAFAVYQQGYQQAVETGNIAGQIRFLNSLGGCQLVQFQFQKALQFWLEGKRLAERHPDQAEEHGAILLNLASLYIGSRNTDAAVEAARQGVAVLEGRKSRPYYLPRLNLILAVVYSRAGDAKTAMPYFRKAIDAADASGDDAAVNLAYNHAGYASLATGELDRAEDYFLSAFRLRMLQKDPDLIYSLVGLGELRRRKGDLTTALLLAERAEAMSATSPIPRHVIYELKARIFTEQNKRAEAHREFQKAFASIRETRAHLLPADFFRIQAEANLEDLYDTALRNAMDWSRTPGAPANLATEMWLAAEEWKYIVAAPARKLVYERLGADYWSTLAEFREVSRKVLLDPDSRNGESKSPTNTGTARLRSLRVKLAEMESYAGIRPFSSAFPENFNTSKPLTLFRAGLGNDSALIGFHTGKRITLRWTFTRNGLEWTEILPQTKLNRLLGEFRRLLRQRRDSQPWAGMELSQELFRGLPLEARSARHWLLVLDGALLESPVAALPAPGDPSRFLIEEHSLAVVTGASALLDNRGAARNNAAEENAMFLGIGDAIYNTADSRWQAVSASKDGKTVKRPVQATAAAVADQGWSFLTRASAASKSGAGQLPRLASSRIELESCARAWNGPSLLLTGSEANRQTAIRTIENGARVLHFSTHFLEKEGAPDEALLMLGLDAQGQAELLSTSDAVHIKVQNSLVVLSGCHSSAGAVYPGAGLVGMTRAWLMAGAQGVVASLWPTPDDSGAIFKSFYSELQKGSLLDRGAAKEAAGQHRGQFLRKAAEALRNAQLEMLRTRSWRALPKYWGTYQLTARAI
ncbi:hypothetical protein F183_A15530 [Bryobacterales bacterium F-183]|nr:hypothetical protein F183_A15530 [Bryobacterales bacterium F-183]